MTTPAAILVPALVVTPDPAVRELVGGMLRFAGYHVHAPRSPRDAVDAVGQPGVELVVFDLDFGSFTPEMLLTQPSLPSGSVPAWMLDRPDLRGRFDLVLLGAEVPTEQELARYLGLGRTIAYTTRPVVLASFRKALARFVARVQPTLVRPAGATGTMLAVPAPEDLEPVEPVQGLRAGRYAAGAPARPGSEHRADRRFDWTADAVLLGQTEERAEIVEISRVGLRLRKRGRELNRGSLVEVAFVKRIETRRGPQVFGIRARGRVVWTAEGMADLHAGLSLEAVEPLGDFIQLLVSLRSLQIDA